MKILNVRLILAILAMSIFTTVGVLLVNPAMQINIAVYCENYEEIFQASTKYEFDNYDEVFE